jgi:hypothetical protein
MDQEHQENQHPDEQPAEQPAQQPPEAEQPAEQSTGQPTEKLDEEPEQPPEAEQPAGQLPEPEQPAGQPTEQLAEPEQPVAELPPPPEPPKEVEPGHAAEPPVVIPPAEPPPQAAVRAQEQPPRETLVTETVAEVLREQPEIVTQEEERTLLRTPFKRNGGPSNISVTTTGEGRFNIEVRVVVVYTPDLTMPALANELRDRIRRRLSERTLEHPGKIDIVFADMVEPSATPEYGRQS